MSRIMIHGMPVFLFVAVLVCSFFYLREGLDHRSDILWEGGARRPLAVSRTTFETPALFSRATILAAQEFQMKQERATAKGTPVFIMTDWREPGTRYIGTSQSIIRQGADGDKMQFPLSGLSGPLIGMALNEQSNNSLYGLTADGKLYSMVLENGITVTEILFPKAIIPIDLEASGLWSQPGTTRLTVVASNNVDSVIIEIDPMEKEIMGELYLPSSVISAGLDPDTHYKLLWERDLSMAIVDWSEKSVIGRYAPNPEFRNKEILKSSPLSAAVTQDRLYVGFSTGNVVELSWKINESLLVFNRDLEVDRENNILIGWRSLSSEPVLYLATLNEGRVSETAITGRDALTFPLLNQGVLKLSLSRPLGQIKNSRYVSPDYRDENLKDLFSGEAARIFLDVLALNRMTGARVSSLSSFPIKIQFEKGQNP